MKEHANFNGFLKTRNDIKDCTSYLKANNLVEHGLDCKNWDIARIVQIISDGNILDMGCDGSFILHNAVRMGLKGEKHGIDLFSVPDHNRCSDVTYIQGDLMNTPYEDAYFEYVTCLSVLEHGVDFNAFAKESSRLLKAGGKLIVTFDYWNPKVDTTDKTLYGLKWNILCQEELGALLTACSQQGLHLDHDIDWSVKDAVINPAYCSPFPGISYTFGMVVFTKR